jgi:hypothetical protein
LYQQFGRRAGHAVPSYAPSPECDIKVLGAAYSGSCGSCSASTYLELGASAAMLSALLDQTHAQVRAAAVPK